MCHKTKSLFYDHRSETDSTLIANESVVYLNKNEQIVAGVTEHTRHRCSTIFKLSTRLQTKIKTDKCERDSHVKVSDS